MIPRRVTLENFLSYGSPAVEISFADDEPLWVLGGPNGAGKSAVFDAMTFCLYGCHRGGVRGQQADHLIRHGADGFRISFEFEIDGRHYRITRAKQRGKPGVQRLEARNADRWEPVPGVNTADQIKEWTERQIGLSFDAYCASVLLRQGESEVVLKAQPRERLNTLKKVIGADRYERLSEQVHTATNLKKGVWENSRRRWQGLEPVAEEVLEAAQQGVEKQLQALAECQQAQEVAIARVSQAESWQELSKRRQALAQQLDEAEARSKKAAAIRRAKTRLDELKAVVPLLEQWLSLRQRLTQSQAEAEAAERQVAAFQRALQARELREQVKQKEALRAGLQQVAEYRRQLHGFPPDLDAQLAHAVDWLAKADETVRVASEARAVAESQLRAAKVQQQKFTTVSVGVKCSLCGQEVTAEHADRERQRLADDVRRYEAECRQASEQEQTAQRERQRAQAEHNRLQRLERERALLAQTLAERERTLGDAPPSLEELTRAIEEMTSQADCLEQESGVDRQLSAAQVKSQLARQERALSDARQSFSQAQGQVQALRDQLPATWQERAEALTPAELTPLRQERQELEQSGVAEQYEQLQAEAIRREEWQRQLADLDRQAEAIPAEARITLAQAQAAVTEAKRATAQAEQALTQARDHLAELKRQQQEYEASRQQLEATERDYRLHEKLDKLLGREGLQRQLVREAERDIVRSANETLKQLSDNRLSLHLVEHKDDEALALAVYKGDASQATEVQFLSGSEKFRVSLAIALAIGRYASGHSRRIESVIIDEGFGSLDKDGLSAAADELQRLKGFLKRIIVVSHQEEFTNRFPVIIQLTPTETGTTARPVRRVVW